MLKIYGSILCPDCVECKKALDEAKVDYTFLDFSDDLRNLKEFLVIRDNDRAFSSVREEGKIGIPCCLDEDGNVSFDWLPYVSQDDA